MKPFDPEKNTFVLTDASKKFGMGYLLLQYEKQDTSRSKPSLVQAGSFALTASQRNYAVIELEMLAVQRAIDKCRFYLFGLDSFTVLSDHKPLEGIMAKELPELHNSRLAALRHKLIPYTFSIEYVQGKKHLAADALSRAPVFEGYEEDDCLAAVRAVRQDPRLKLIAWAGSQDKDYKQTIKALKSGKEPNSSNIYTPELRKCWEELSVIQLQGEEDEVIMRGDRIFPPRQLRDEILAKAHESHQGTDKLAKAVKMSYFWPAVENEAKNMVEACPACQIHADSQPRENPCPIVPTIDRPMEHVNADIFAFGGRTYLCVVDAYSGVIWAPKLKGSTSSDIISALKEIFANVGFPEALRTDNAANFESREMKEFCSQYGIVLEHSSPYFPSSNGIAENGVKQAKKILKKCYEDKTDAEEALMKSRFQPRSDGQIPMDLLTRRKTRGPELRMFSDPNEVVTKKNDATSDDTSETRKYSALEIGEKVRVQHPLSKKWDEVGWVTQGYADGHSYGVQLESGAITRRNRKFLKIYKEPRDKDVKNQFKLTDICEIDSDSVPIPERKELRYGRHYIVGREGERIPGPLGGGSEQGDGGRLAALRYQQHLDRGIAAGHGYTDHHLFGVGGPVCMDGDVARFPLPNMPQDKPGDPRRALTGRDGAPGTRGETISPPQAPEGAAPHRRGGDGGLAAGGERQDSSSSGREEGPREAPSMGIFDLDDLAPVYFNPEDWPLLPLPQQNARIDRVKGCVKT